MEVKFRTLTPIFTGDRFTNQSHQLRETALLGSLRFWGQAITRGLGYKVTGDDGKSVQCCKDDITYQSEYVAIFKPLVKAEGRNHGKSNHF
jgi:CRISPR-associated protein Cmr1